GHQRRAGRLPRPRPDPRGVHGAPEDGMPVSRVAIVTGASRGIGRAAALALARRGYHLALAARGATALEETAREAGSAGARARAIPTDVSDEAAVRRLVDVALEQFGTLDALVNAAGFGRFAPIQASDSGDWHATLSANLTGTYYCC